MNTATADTRSTTMADQSAARQPGPLYRRLAADPRGRRRPVARRSMDRRRPEPPTL